MSNEGARERKYWCMDSLPDDARDDDAAPPAPANRDAVAPVFLHIGAMKTGTTYLQRVLIDQKDRLAADGYLFPGKSWREQVRAAQEIARSAPEDQEIQSQMQGAWQSVTAQMLRHDGVASIVSMEFLSHAEAPAAREAVRSLAPAEVHVILTVRDAAATIPAQWQTAISNQNTFGWEDFRTGTRQVVKLRSKWGPFQHPAAAIYRRTQDVARILDAWGQEVPSERLHVVTVPSRSTDPMLLWKRFASVIGLDTTLAENVERANESMGYASTELLRRVNQDLGRIPPLDYNGTLRSHLARRILSSRRSSEERPMLDTPTYQFALDWNRRNREAIEASGAHIVGELADLPAAATSQHRGGYVVNGQSPPSPEELLTAAHTATEGLRALIGQRARRARKSGIDTGPLDLRRRQHEAERAGADIPDPVSAAVAEIAELSRAAMDVRRLLRQQARGPNR